MGGVATDVDIDFVTKAGEASRHGGGATQVRIDGDRLNRYVDEDQLEDGIHWKEYAGDYVYGDLYNILETTTEILTNPTVYEVREVQFAGYDEYLALEYLGEGVLRVAFRVVPDRSDDSFHFVAVPESACGYPVEATAWAAAVRDVVERFQAELRDLGEGESADWFDSELVALEDVLQDGVESV